jgi:hypothetical protein
VVRGPRRDVLEQVPGVAGLVRAGGLLRQHGPDVAQGHTSPHRPVFVVRRTLSRLALRRAPAAAYRSGHNRRKSSAPVGPGEGTRNFSGTLRSGCRHFVVKGGRGSASLLWHPLEILRICQKKRADERTRTADLLITSVLSRIHCCFQMFQKSLT